MNCQHCHRKCRYVGDNMYECTNPTCTLYLIEMDVPEEHNYNYHNTQEQYE